MDLERRRRSGATPRALCEEVQQGAVFYPGGNVMLPDGADGNVSEITFAGGSRLNVVFNENGQTAPESLELRNGQGVVWTNQGVQYTLRSE